MNKGKYDDDDESDEDGLIGWNNWEKKILTNRSILKIVLIIRALKVSFNLVFYSEQFYQIYPQNS